MRREQRFYHTDTLRAQFNSHSSAHREYGLKLEIIGVYISADEQ